MTPSRQQPKGYIASEAAGTGLPYREARIRSLSATGMSMTRPPRERRLSGSGDELVERLAEGREPAEKATVSMLLDRWLGVADLYAWDVGSDGLSGSSADGGLARLNADFGKACAAAVLGVGMPGSPALKCPGRRPALGANPPRSCSAISNRASESTYGGPDRGF
jgi:hypothetical protein